MENRYRNTISRIDWLTVVLFLAMVSFGWVNVFSATYDETQPGSLFSFTTRYSKQFYFILAAFVIAIVLMIVDGKFWGFFAYFIYAGAFILLAATLFAGREINGARSWLILGPISIQPAEIMKLATVLAIAKLVSRFNFQVHRLKNLIILGFIIGIPVLIIMLQNDTGTALVYFSLVLVLFREGLSGVVLLLVAVAVFLYVMTLLVPIYILIPLISIMALILASVMERSVKYFLWGGLVYLIGTGLAYLLNGWLSTEWSLTRILLLASVISFIFWLAIVYRHRLNHLYLILVTWLAAVVLIFSVEIVFHEVLEPHQQARINQVLGIDFDPLGSGYNLNQSKIAIGSGGFSGKGFLNGTQTRFKFVPEQSTDFIFCTVGEEWGFLGSLLVIGLFTGLLIRLVVLAERQRSVFSRVFGYGVVSILFFHYAVNLGMTIGMMPVIGIPLPFFSYGGSSLWGFTLLLFVFLRLDTSRYEVVA